MVDSKNGYAYVYEFKSNSDLVEFAKNLTSSDTKRDYIIFKRIVLEGARYEDLVSECSLSVCSICDIAKRVTSGIKHHYELSLKYGASVYDFNFSTRVTNCLLRNGIETKDDLIGLLYKVVITSHGFRPYIRALGMKGLNEIIEKTVKLGYISDEDIIRMN